MSLTYEQLQQRRAEFAERLGELMREFHDVAGPQLDPITEQPCDHDRDEICECRLPETCMLTEFVLLTGWSDISKARENGEWSHQMYTPGMTRRQQKGLMFTHLFG